MDRCELTPIRTGKPTGYNRLGEQVVCSVVPDHPTTHAVKTTLGTATRKSYRKPDNVLIVEDNDDHWMLIQQAFRQCLPHVSAHRAATAQQALTQLDEWQYQGWEQPRLILVDLYLPDRLDGFTLIETIRALPAPLSHIPLLIYSASNDRVDIFNTYELGASSYLPKPTNSEDWLTFMERLRAFWWETAILPRAGFTF